MKEIPESIQQMDGIKRRLVFQVIVVDSQVALIGEHFKRIPHKQHIASNDFDMNAAGIGQMLMEMVNLRAGDGLNMQLLCLRNRNGSTERGEQTRGIVIIRLFHRRKE